MLIAIASDLHDNIANWHKFNDYLKKQDIKILFFCGDLCNQDTLSIINESFVGDMYFIAGNGELYLPETLNNYPNLHFLGRYGDITIDEFHFGLIHEINYRQDLEKEVQPLNYIFYGHSHKPWIEIEKTLIIANPGTLGGIFYPASFAIFNTDNKKIELKLLYQ